MDLDPFVPVGIDAATVRFLDVFLLHCLLTDSPPDTPAEIAALGRNQHHTASHGREPGLRLERDGESVLLTDWAAELLHQCEPIAAALDALHGGRAHAEVVSDAQARLADPETLPSARMLAAMQRDFGGGYTAFIRAQSEQTRNRMLALPWSAEQQAAFEAQARESLRKQRQIEAADSVDFETWRQAYLSEDTLAPRA